MNGKSLSNRILGGSFAASVVVNLAWVAAVSHSGLFGAASGITQLHEREFKVFKPIPQKPQVKQKELTPLPPPKPKPPIKIKPLKEIKVKEIKVPQIKAASVKIARPLPEPRQMRASHPSSAAPQIAAESKLVPVPASAPVITHPVRIATIRSAPGPMALPNDSIATAPTRPFVPSSVSSAETPRALLSAPVQAPQIAPKAPTQSEAATPKKEASEQAKPAVHKSAPVEEVHPDKWVPIERQEASVPENIEVKTDDISRDTLNNDKVVVSFTIDENGDVRSVRVTTPCGNSEMDNRCLEAIQRLHCQPAIQDHIPRRTQKKYTFDL